MSLVPGREVTIQAASSPSKNFLCGVFSIEVLMQSLV
jgi:hypothetical protein